HHHPATADDGARRRSGAPRSFHAAPDPASRGGHRRRDRDALARSDSRRPCRGSPVKRRDAIRAGLTLLPLKLISPPPKLMGFAAAAIVASLWIGAGTGIAQERAAEARAETVDAPPPPPAEREPDRKPSAASEDTRSTPTTSTPTPAP